MGNKLCKKRVDTVDNSKPKPFNRIINKFSLKQKWKSDTNLEEKQQNKSATQKKGIEESINSLSKSSDWTEVDLEVPDKKVNNNHSVVVNENKKPVPPPRKKKGLREKLESVSFLQAFTTSDKPIDEPICVKKTVDTKCPCCNGRKHIHEQNQINNKKISATENSLRDSKGRKTPSISSLPNYNDFKLSVAGEADIDDLDKHSSAHSLPDESKKQQSTKSSNDKIDYLTRARSFGSLLPTMLLHKMSTTKAPLAEIESDDSLGMDDWGLNMIEHYKPKDSSLPRPRKTLKTDEELFQSIKDQLVVDEKPELPPLPPARKIDRKNSTEYLNEDKIEHSNLMKILEQYSDKNQNNIETKIISKPINDFLEAERANIVR